MIPPFLKPTEQDCLQQKLIPALGLVDQVGNLCRVFKEEIPAFGSWRQDQFKVLLDYTASQFKANLATRYPMRMVCVPVARLPMEE